MTSTTNMTERRAVRMIAAASVLVLTFQASPAVSQAAVTDAAFPPATPESQGMSAEALAELADVVRDFLGRDMLIGGELIIIKNRHLVLQETFGMRDVEQERPWEKNTICNIRSMSKPLTGAAAQILIDRGQLALSDPVAMYIPAFDNETHGAITIEQLLTHQSGLPLTPITMRIDQFGDLQSLASSLAGRELEAAPGEKFWYSDAGTDTLGAIVEKVSGKTLDQFVTTELIEPLGMSDSFYGIHDDEPRWERAASLYIGGPNAWTRFWTPDNGALYPFAWGSQTIYSTPIDYAKFLCMWMDGGSAGEKQVLSEDAVKRTLTPAVPMKMLGSDARFPTSFSGLEVYYGQMSVLHMPTDDPANSEPVIIGHSGSDGTIAWAWPDRDLIILFFTQSRGGMSAMRLEEHIDRLILNPGRAAAAVPEELKEYLGVYVANFASYECEPFEILYRNGNLALDIPSQMVFDLVGPDVQTRWAFAISPDNVKVRFERDAEGRIREMKLIQSGVVFTLPREGTPEADALAMPAPVDAEAVRKFSGLYYHPESDVNIEVFHDGERLCMKAAGAVVHLRATDDPARWEIRQMPGVLVHFNEENGKIVSMTRIVGEEALDLPRVEDGGRGDDDR